MIPRPFDRPGLVSVQPGRLGRDELGEGHEQRMASGPQCRRRGRLDERDSSLVRLGSKQRHDRVERRVHTVRREPVGLVDGAHGGRGDLGGHRIERREQGIVA
ncbi:hypothetical protein [Aeromicrobium sp. UC242_57]|uniref:hypothetical protein n=1 Tax=Aeromicrobium sp. UC242_57 TaxID=3374624 RepID=UPI0037AC4864